jgi:signal transduction histidine kinase
MINRRFEARPWLLWSRESLQRLNPAVLWQWHQEHEMPREWYAWDYTFSWLIQNNHPQVANKVVIFNHTVEDEPPAEAAETHTWMNALLSHPMRRKVVAEMVETLAKSGAAGIILDNDYPQYSADDPYLAKVLHNCTAGVYGKSIPVFMVRAMNKFSSPTLQTLEAPTSPVGILAELQKLEPGVNVTDKYTGMTCVSPDTDQVIRRANIRIPNPSSGEKYEAVILKMLERLGKPVPENLPDTVDIDFATVPNSELYPIYSQSTLLDPEQKAKILAKNSPIDLKDAIVFVGDGITDVYSTPFTNDGDNQMSGTEILANAMDTISRGSWPHRLPGWADWMYMALASVAGGALWGAWKDLQQNMEGAGKGIQKAGGSLFRLATDTLFFCFLIAGTLFAGCVVFAYGGWLVPVFVPSIALGVGTLAANVWEREREREKAFQDQLRAQQEKHALELENVETEMAKQEIEAENREMYQDRKRRHEFVRRINHDLNAPVSVLNWTIAELQMMNLENEKAKDKVSRLVKSSDKLCELIDQLVQSYDYEHIPGLNNNQAALCDLTQVLDDCVDGQQPLAQKFDDIIEWQKPENSLWVKGNALELSRVIDNIIRNAIKHNANHTSVFVSIDSNGSFHKILISDSGKGIAPEHIQHIFEPGYRVNPEKKDGHGLGLDIAKTLVEAMGGELSVTSTIGKGTTFQIKLPVCPEARALHQDFLDDETIEETYSRKPTLEIATHKRIGD